MEQTQPLDLPELRSLIASYLRLKDIASCARVSHDWNDLFTPLLYRSVTMSNGGLSLETVQKNKQLIQHMKLYGLFDMNQSLSTVSPALSALAQMFSSVLANSSLTTLSIMHSFIHNVGVLAIAQALKTNSTLSTLILRADVNQGKGIKALLDALKSNSGLTTLEIGVKIKKNQTRSLAEALKNNSTLSSLNLSFAVIKDHGAIKLAEALKINRTLHTLELGFNDIQEPGAGALAIALGINSTLTF